MASMPGTPKPPESMLPQSMRPPKLWKYFGAIFMEEKSGHQAVSYTRVLGFVLFLASLPMWYGLGGAGADGHDVPQTMLYTLWGLIGIKGGKDIAKALGKSK